MQGDAQIPIGMEAIRDPWMIQILMKHLQGGDTGPFVSLSSRLRLDVQG